MDFATNTEGENSELKLNQENILLEMVKEIGSETCGRLSPSLQAKVNRIIADCQLKHYTSLQRVTAADGSTSTLLGFLHRTHHELIYEEQLELNQVFIDKIEKEIPRCIKELDKLKKTDANRRKLREDQLNELKKRDEMLNSIQEQESEQMELLMEWLNHRIKGVSQFSDHSSDYLALRTKVLNLKSKILNLQILQNIFTETNQSIKSYTEVHKDLKDRIKETEQRIKTYREIIDNDLK